MASRHNLKHSIYCILKANHDGSYSTQHIRKQRLLQIADQIIDGGYHLQHVKQIKSKHINFLIAKWQQQNLSAGTIKNRMTDLRWLMQKLNKPGLIPKSNDALNIERRQYITNKDKSLTLTDGDLDKIRDPYVKHSLLLQQAFGLRREESIKIKIYKAVQGDELRLDGSWCKIGRSRTIPIRNHHQRNIIAEVKQFIHGKQQSLIPHNKNYYQQLKRYENQTNQANFNKAHGLRHAYAQQRYLELTGRICPAQGGLCYDQLSKQQQKVDREARQQISLELGHERLEILGVYVGK